MTREFSGTVEIAEDGDTGTVTITLDPDDAAITLGTAGEDGDVYVTDNDDNETIHLGGNDARLRLGQDGDNDGDVFLHDHDGYETIHLGGHRALLDIGGGGAAPNLGPRRVYGGDHGEVLVKDRVGTTMVSVEAKDAQIDLGAEGEDGDVFVRDKNGADTIHLGGNDARLRLGGYRAGGGFSGDPVKGEDGDVMIKDKYGFETARLDGSEANLTLGHGGKDGDIFITDNRGDESIHLGGNDARLRLGHNGDNDGDIFLHDDDGNETIHLGGEAGDIFLKNADCAEEFDTAEEDVDAGSVVVLDDADTVRTSREAYDTRVAGVVSGAGDYRPGMILDKQTEDGNRLPVALMGKVGCKVDASAAPVEVGDMLTTACEPGYAMKATDPERSFGAVLGKALEPLASGTGLVPVLVTLQ